MVQDVPPITVEVPPGSVLEGGEESGRIEPPSTGVVVMTLPADGSGRVEPPSTGTIAYAFEVADPEALSSAGYELQAHVKQLPSDAPLLIVVRRADRLRRHQLQTAVDAVEGSEREVVLRVLADG
jgi:hypothetical protein